MTEKKPILNIHQRINAIMGELDYVRKGNKKVNNQYTFVSHDAVTAAIHPLLVKHGINIIPTVTDSSIEWTKYEETYNNNTKTKFRGFTRALVDVHYVNIDDPKDCVTISQVGYGIDEQDKGIGKAVSYACKYAMLKVFMLETGDDPEKDLIDHKPEEKKPWTGPLGKTKLGAALRDYMHQVNGAETIADIDDIKKDYLAIINQAGVDDPEALYGDGKDHIGIIAEVTKLKANLQPTEDQKKQLEQPKDI